MSDGFENYTGPRDEAGNPVALTPGDVWVRREAARDEARLRKRYLRRVAAGGVEYHPPQEARGAAASAMPPWETRHLVIKDVAPPREVQLLWAGMAPPAQETLPKCVACRVDWLLVAFKVAFFPGALERLAARLDEHEQARVAVEIAGAEYELRRLPAGTLIAQNADAVVKFETHACEGWTVTVEFSGSRMMRTTVQQARELARRLATVFGAQHGERVRRLDLSADFANFKVGDVTPRAFCKPSRARLVRATIRDTEKEEQPAMRQNFGGKGAPVTGFTVCPGNTLQAVIYDKREELKAHPEKRPIEEARWRAGGWDGVSDVARVEFRLRTEALHDLGCRDGLDAFAMNLDELWQYCTQIWLRIIVPRSGTRLSRCAIDPIWEAVRKATFQHEALPGARYRVRGGAPAAMAFGAMVSTLARDQWLPPLRERVNEETGEVLDEEGQLQGLDATECAALAREDVLALAVRAAGHMVDDFLSRMAPRDVALFVRYRVGAARARFTTALGPPKSPSVEGLLAA